MTALFIIGAVLLLVLLILFLPVTVEIKFFDDFYLKIRFSGITVFRLKPYIKEEIREKSDEIKEKSERFTDKAIHETKGAFSALCEEKGFLGALKEVFAFAGRVLSHIKGLLRHINIYKVRLNITVGTNDAAQTATYYGIVCQTVYPVTAYLASFAKVGYKEININSDFKNGKCDFAFAATLKMQIFYLLMAAYKIYSEYKIFVTEKKENERE